ncbi:LysR family transcriptional regulator [Modestobacter versicolor]|uniref:DNA-binding transcriptional LysR family regulator n=1 Tax=Modestobacter versicolor TaxID=429133 RepID=A0A323V3S6_9ACTN|nr:LysR family transcriptional regulator [Modestobacter versicolor]MBB3675120.1 DNA-binding transcriptional LysR family regulator [Modestobacter versicolor]PZA19402.1 LysR family transcriptional regulator [Modestobacter versicolor]
MDPEVRQLRALLAVVEAGTFTGAASLLGVSQASVSRTVVALERALGARVLQRTTRAVALTPVGERVAAHARRVLEEVAAMRRTAGQDRGELRIGFAWAALGRHTVAVQRAWSRARPGTTLVFVQSVTPTAGLAEGLADVSVLRRPVDDRRLRSAVVGEERRYAAVAADDPLARRRSLRLADLHGRTLAVDRLTGSTTDELWGSLPTPPATRSVRGVDEWLTVIAAGQAVGMTAGATAAQHPRPGVVYRPVRDAPPVAVQLTWWADSPPEGLAALRALVTAQYAGERSPSGAMSKGTLG